MLLVVGATIISTRNFIENAHAAEKHNLASVYLSYPFALIYIINSLPFSP